MITNFISFHLLIWANLLKINIIHSKNKNLPSVRGIHFTDIKNHLILFINLYFKFVITNSGVWCHYNYYLFIHLMIIKLIILKIAMNFYEIFFFESIIRQNFNSQIILSIIIHFIITTDFMIFLDFILSHKFFEKLNH